MTVELCGISKRHSQKGRRLILRMGVVAACEFRGGSPLACVLRSGLSSAADVAETDRSVDVP